MTEQQKRKRFLITASIKGVERAEDILKRRGVSSISAFAKAQVLGKSSVDKFLSRQPIQADTFIKICEGLEIKDWKELAELEPVLVQVEKVAQARTLQGCLTQDARKVSESFRRVTVLDPIGEVKIEITFEGSIEAVTADVQRLIEACMKNAGGDTIRITDIRPGSIKVTVQGSPRDIARLLDQINSGELTEVEGFPIQDSQILSEDFLADVGQQSNVEKWELIADIIKNPKIARQLRGANLSDADLSNAILINADLTNADLSGSDLSNADLRARNQPPNFRDPRARRLARRLNLRARNPHPAGRQSSVLRTNLKGADLTDTIVEGCLFGEGVGLSDVQKEYLKRRGAIFNDAPGDRRSVKTPSPTRR